MRKRRDALHETSGILPANKIRQLEEAGLTIVWQDQWRWVSEFYHLFGKYCRFEGKPFYDLEDDGLMVVERKEWKRLKRLEEAVKLSRSRIRRRRYHGGI